MKRITKVLSFVLALVCLCAFPVGASAANVEDATIDYTKTGSLTLYKYDLTSATEAGVWDSSSYVSTGQYDQSILDAMNPYAIQGVEFSYIRLADITTYDNSANNAHEVITLYAFEESDASAAFLSAIGLSYSDAFLSESGFHYYRSHDLTTALATALNTNATAVKNALENHVAANGGTAMTVTDEYGHTEAADLELGLYLVVETKVPENVTVTCNPFLVSLPMTTIDGNEWNYDITVYPKNATGDPTLEKTVREAVASTGKSEAYAHTATASGKDTLEYQILSKLPTITSEASYLSCYTFTDRRDAGLAQPQNVTIEFYKDAACTEKIATWASDSGKFTASFAGQTMTIVMEESGLAEINSAATVYGADSIYSGYSDCTMRITYSCLLNGDASAVYGSDGNNNTVMLVWMRSNTDHSDYLEDDAHVNSYGIDLTKLFSDGAGDFAKVQFVLKNETDNYFVQATGSNGVYHMTGRTDKAEDATVFVPSDEGHIIVKGLEDDTYIATEIATADGYTLLKDGICIEIAANKGDACSECGETLLVGSAEVNDKAVAMIADGESDGAIVPLKVVNTKGFNLPQTGSYGTWMFTVGGVLAMGAAVFILVKLRRKDEPTENN